MSDLSDIFDPNRKNQSIVTRITDFCNNKCAHCCFSCDPRCDQFMTLDTMKQLASLFSDTNDVCYWYNLMGGETTLHPDYEELVEVLAGRHVRFVTNGWWIKNDKAKDRFLNFVKTSGATLHIGVSRDKFHPSGVGQKAYDFLMSHNVSDDFGLTTPNPEDEEGSIASVGRAYWNYIGAMRSTFMAYCQSSNTRHTSFTCLEDGTLTHCPFGIWPLGTIYDSIEELYKRKQDAVDRWERAMPSCRSCYKQWEFGGRIKVSEKYPIYKKTPL